MGQSEALHLARRAPARQPELLLGDLAQELLLPLQAVRLGMVLVRRQTPRAPEVIQKIDATLQAMERTVGELNAHDEAYGSWDGERLRPLVRNVLANARDAAGASSVAPGDSEDSLQSASVFSLFRERRPEG
jgi:signal transduction histidine kinase